MPSSRPNAIPTVINLVRQLKPNSILDVGIGFGKWGHLFREYSDIQESEHDPARYQRTNWKVRIDGIEGFSAYVTEMHYFLYNDIHIGNAIELLPNLPAYDLIFMGDIIEHLDKEKGLELLNNAIRKARKAVIVSTPKYETDQADLCGNELERHRSSWSVRDFQNLDGAIVTTVDRSIILAVLLKPGVPTPSCKPPTQPRPADLRRLSRMKADLAELIPLGTPFILVDEEQIRSDIPHSRAIPFIEKEGQYWGPPDDDATAIVELERLRGEGARRIVFTWPTFWWLSHYAGFAEHLRKSYRCLKENRQLIVFALDQ